MKKITSIFLVFVALFTLSISGGNKSSNSIISTNNTVVTSESFSNKQFSAQSFVEGKVKERIKTEDNYASVTNSAEFIDAINNKKEIIEIKNDLDLGFKVIQAETKKSENDLKKLKVTNFQSRNKLVTSEAIEKSGISQIEISNVKGMTIFSQNGATLKHVGFKINQTNDLVIRNLKFDELWQWEDSLSADTYKIGDYDLQGWSYFKINFSHNIWLDHLVFGKSYDGLIDAENSSTGVTISWCQFLAGDASSYYKDVMSGLEKSYLDQTIKYVYYKYLRDSGLSATDIYELFKGQKKGFMIGGSDDVKKDEWTTNKQLEFSIINTYFKNLQDRLPRLRGGSSHIYNVHVDNNEIYETQRRIKSYSLYKDLVNGIVANNWKLAFTNQGMVTTNGGSVKYENSIFEGVRELIKTNNYDTTSTVHTGSYLVENVVWKIENVLNAKGNSWDIETPFVSSTRIAEPKFVWNTESKTIDYKVILIDLEDLSKILNEQSGTLSTDLNWLKVAY
ncbi:hypothetical protein [Acholeplasma palmae]|nr:hypothetical protein [Alteracholeplasma palmae]